MQNQCRTREHVFTIPGCWVRNASCDALILDTNIVSCRAFGKHFGRTMKRGFARSTSKFTREFPVLKFHCFKISNGYS